MIRHLLTNKEDIQLHMFSSNMQNRTVTQSNYALIVRINDRSREKGTWISIEIEHKEFMLQ